MDLVLREACEADMDLLYMWANDKTVRQNAFHTEQIPYEDHVEWFGKMMADSTVRQYILCDENNAPLGQIRLNIGDGKALVDYSISEENRGKGYGSRMLALAENKISGVTEIIAQVKKTNIASQRAFERCGYEREEKVEYIQYKRILK